ncbi:MAG: polysaccharide ABC transporter ATP-binding protein [Bacteroidota bacterium]
MKIIELENISKQYRLGLVSSRTVAGDLNRFWARIRGKEDPTLKIGVGNTLDVNDGEYVWALKDINMAVAEGEVLGIIGKNGAGKSTLLKILSKVTTPTTGLIKIKGRIASLLEVGTGFHPELTGRENIFLNGAILGMTKREIRTKFDEIVEFSGVGKYIDTPVKRYSSGMYVRLAFAVAAHLEPEILIVDEVLAVGDADFQKKCLGKMKDVAGEGRTVLFVSHNMTAVRSLCKNAILLKQGMVEATGTADDMVDHYLKLGTGNLVKNISYDNPDVAPGNENIRIKTVNVSPDDIAVDKEVTLTFEFWNMQQEQKIKIAFDLLNLHEQIVFGSATDVSVDFEKKGKTVCTIPANLLNDDIYSVNLFFFTEGMRPLYMNKEILSFEVRDIQRDYAYFGKVNGIVRPQLKWAVSGENEK